MKRRSFLRLALLALAGCTVPQSLVFRPGILSDTDAPTVCSRGPVIVPTPPAETIGPDLLDVSTGLHVKNYEVKQIDPVSYRLKVTGLVDHPLELTLDDLCSMPKITSKVVCTCRGYFEDVTTYSGVPLTHVLGLAGVQSGAKAVYLTDGENYPGYLSLEDALKEDNFLAYQWKNEPLPILHGFPVRAVIPSMMGYTWTKFLVEIKVEIA